MLWIYTRGSIRTLRRKFRFGYHKTTGYLFCNHSRSRSPFFFCNSLLFSRCTRWYLLFNFESIFTVVLVLVNYVQFNSDYRKCPKRFNIFSHRLSIASLPSPLSLKNYKLCSVYSLFLPKMLPRIPFYHKLATSSDYRWIIQWQTHFRFIHSTV